MKVEQPDLRRVEFDCPWIGHLLSDILVIRNPAVPALVGRLCIKCGSPVYVMEQSEIVGPGGESLPKTLEG